MMYAGNLIQENQVYSYFEVGKIMYDIFRAFIVCLKNHNMNEREI